MSGGFDPAQVGRKRMVLTQFPVSRLYGQVTADSQGRQNGNVSPGSSLRIPELSTRTPAKGFRHPRVDFTSWTQSHLMPAFA